LARLLREAGCEVLAELPDGPSVLAWMETAPPLDALFLDIHMPGASGLELVAELKDPPPVVFVTAFSEHAVRAFETDAVDYVLKPISGERLATAAYIVFAAANPLPTAMIAEMNSPRNSTSLPDDVCDS
jgi:two-component system LytT family response regulator/two-component system response regulator AlgR